MRYTILDIETRIDKRLVRQVYHPDADLSDEDAYGQVRQQLKQEQGSDFFPISFHIPVSIAVGQVDEEHVLTAVETLAGEDADEETMVRTFWQRLDRFRGTLVTFNGRGFDLPVLELQALKYGCPAPHYFGGKARYRFSQDGHYDLYDFVTNYGAQRLRGGLNLLAKMIGLPGKVGIDGSLVQQYWEAGRLPEIHRYCRHDVIQTYFLFLRLELVQGRLTPDQYADSVERSAGFRQQLDAQE